MLVTQLCLTLCDPIDCSPPVYVDCPWDFPGKNIGVGSYSLLQGIFPTQGSNPGLLHCRQIFYIIHAHVDLRSFRFFPHIAHCTILTRVPCAVQQVLVSYLVYISYCIYVNLSLSIYSPPPSSYFLRKRKIFFK